MADYNLRRGFSSLKGNKPQIKYRLTGDALKFYNSAGNRNSEWGIKGKYNPQRSTSPLWGGSLLGSVKRQGNILDNLNIKKSPYAPAVRNEEKEEKREFNHGYHFGPSSGKKSYSSGTKSGDSRRKPFYMTEDGALFDENMVHIPTDDVPLYVKGPAWNKNELMAYDREKLPSYGGENIHYEGSFNGSGSHISHFRPDFSVDLNPYKKLLKELEDVRAENLKLSKRALEDDYSSFYKDAYIKHLKNKNSLDEKLAGLGLSGGSTESIRAYMDTSYMNNLKELEKEKLRKSYDLQTKYNDGIAKDKTMASDMMQKEIDRLNREKLAYEKLLEERSYREERDRLKARESFYYKKRG